MTLFIQQLFNRLALAIAETMTSTYISSAVGEAVAFIVLVAVLAIRPTGLCARIVVYGMNIILGFTGQLSPAQRGFFGIDACAVGLLTTDYDWSLRSAFAVAVIGTAVVAYLSGLIAQRTRDEYFAMAFGFIIYLTISRWESVAHAHSGVNNVKFPEAGDLIDFSSPTAMFHLVFNILLVCVYITYAIRRSGVGRTLLTIRTGEDLADAIGVKVGLSKQLAFAASAVFGGGLCASVVGFIGPDAASVDKTFEFLMFILVGGMDAVAGPLIGSMIVTFLFEFFQAYRFIVLGPSIIALVIFAPRGIVGYLGGFGGPDAVTDVSLDVDEGKITAVIGPTPQHRREARINEDKTLEALGYCGVWDCRHDLASNVPQEVQKRTAVAMALATEPVLILLAEPAGGIPEEETADFGNLIRSLRQRGGCVLLVEHTMSMIMDLADTILVLDHGQKLALGTPAEIQSNPDVVTAYLGSSKQEEN